jgi:hypothetical protein
MDIRSFFGKCGRPTPHILRITRRGDSGQDLTTQKRIHRLCFQLADELNRWKDEGARRLFVPEPLTPTTSSYLVSGIYTTHPVRLADDLSLLPEFIALWKKMWYYGFALYDFELYRQPDGRIAVLNFEKTCFRQTNPDAPMFTYPFRLQEGEDKDRFYFQHPCFPPNFLDFLVGPEDGLRAQMKRVATLKYKSEANFTALR